jgi:hypothetical protein
MAEKTKITASSEMNRFSVAVMASPQSFCYCRFADRAPRMLRRPRPGAEAKGEDRLTILALLPYR